FFMGWGGGDLDGNSDYIRLRSEADTARIYWLLLPDAEEPKSIQEIKESFQDNNRLDKFVIVRGKLQGTIVSENDSFREKTKEWAKEIGSEWCKLAIEDLEKDINKIPTLLEV